MALPFSTRISSIYTLTAGQTGPFAQTWPLYAAADALILRKRAGVVAELVLGADYSVTGAGSDSSGFSVLLLAGALDGDQLVIAGARDVARITTYTAERGTTPTFLNLDLNMVFAQLQEMQRDVDRSFKTSFFDPNVFDIAGRRLSNVGAAVDPADAVNLGQIEAAIEDATTAAIAAATADAIAAKNAAQSAAADTDSDRIAAEAANAAAAADAGAAAGSAASAASDQAAADVARIAAETAQAAAEAAKNIILALPRREMLTGNRTYYVRGDGSDSNNGLANTSGGAFLTIQKAFDTAYSLDLNGYTVTIQVGNGTYGASLVMSGRLVGARPGSGYPLTIQGDTATPANVVLSVASADIFNFYAGAECEIKGFQLQTFTSGNLIVATGHCRVGYGNILFGSTATDQLVAQDWSVIRRTANVTIAGNVGGQHWHAVNGGLIASGSGTITLSGTPNFGARFAGVSKGILNVQGTVFSGGATGTRFLVHENGVIDTDGAAEASYFPGNAAGTKTNGGIWV